MSHLPMYTVCRWCLHARARSLSVHARYRACVHQEPAGSYVILGGVPKRVGTRGEVHGLRDSPMYRSQPPLACPVPHGTSRCIQVYSRYLQVYPRVCDEGPMHGVPASVCDEGPCTVYQGVSATPCTVWSPFGAGRHSQRCVPPFVCRPSFPTV